MTDKNTEFITNCLAETGIDFDEDNVVITGDMCVIVASPAEEESNYKSLRRELCNATEEEIRLAIDIIEAELAERQ